MILPQRGLVWCTRQGESEVSDQAVRWITKGHENYLTFVQELLTGNDPKTPIFEWCSRENRIVVDYPKDRLVLTAIRNHRTGEYASYDDMVQLAKNYNIDFVKVLPEPVKEMEKSLFMNQVKTLVDEEGYVVRFADGQMYKIKAELHLQQHRNKNSIDNERAVVEMILAGNLIDDLLPALRPTDRDALLAFQNLIMSSIQQAAVKVESVIAEAKVTLGNDKRKFATEFIKSPQCADYDSKVWFDAWKEIDTAEVIKMAILRNIGKAEEGSCREHCMGGHTWQAFRDAASQVKTTDNTE